MSEPQNLGGFIRERRLALGFSAGQLAMRLHSTAAVVRTWERGHERIPDDALPGLAELLAVDEAELRALQPVAAHDEAAPEDAVAVASPSEDAPALAEAVPDPGPAAVVVPKKGRSAKGGGEGASSADSEHPAPPTVTEADADAPDTEPGSFDEPVEFPDRSPNGESGSRGGVGHAPGLVVDTGLLEAPTEAIEPIRPGAAASASRAATGTRVRPETKPGPVTRPPVVPETPSVEPAAVLVDGSVPDWLGPLHVLFDPSKRYLYWARWIGTAIGLYILLRILGFAVDGLLEAIGDFWDSFSTPEPAGTGDGSTVDALASIFTL